MEMKRLQAEDLKRKAEEAAALTVYTVSGLPEKLVESLRCQNQCTRQQEKDATNFAKACTESGAKAYPGLCCDTVCSHPVATLGELFVQPFYLTVGEKATIQFSTDIKGLPRDWYNNVVVELEQVGSGNKTLKNFGRFYDNGQDGDLLANDGFQTARVELKENRLGLLNFRSRLLRPNGTWLFGKISSLEIQPKNILSKPRNKALKTLHHPKYGDVVASNIIVTVRKGTLSTKVKSIAAKIKCKIIERMAYDAWVLETEADTVEAMDRAIRDLRLFSEITAAEPNHVGKGF